MKKNSITLPEIKLVGIKVRTNNNDEFNPEKAKIINTINTYFADKISDKISNRINPGILYCAYTEYASDENGDYSYFVGEEVQNFNESDNKLETLTIPSSSYAKFECGPGKMPQVCIDAWKKIWQMSANDLGGQRNYIADFEVYDERAQDQKNAIFNIYIGLK